MFLSKEDFEESINIMEAYEDLSTDDEIRNAVAIDFAKELFDNFESMGVTERAEVISMILEDMSMSVYSIN